MLFHTIVTHERPHIDEIGAILLLRKRGERVFPGISEAEIKFWPAGSKTPDGRPATEYEAEGYVLVGVGGSRFDEHPNASEGRKIGKCAATLVADFLGIGREPAFQKVLKYISLNDLNGGAHPFELASLVKLMYRQHPEAPENVVEWAIAGLEAKCGEQEEFFSGIDEFRENACVENVAFGARFVKVATICSDNEQMSKIARSEHGCQAEVVILRKTSGHTQIFGSGKTPINDLAIRILNEERRVKGLAERPVSEAGAGVLEEGTPADVPEWYYFPRAAMLFNGSLTNKSVPPTRLGTGRIRELVVEAFKA